MRHRDNIYYSSNKAHLARLPNLESHEVPPRVVSPSKRGLVIIPLFTGITNLIDDKVFVGLISALWARRSWLLNSDAMDYGIEIKLYMENCLSEDEHIMSILEQNGAREEDILWFDGSSVEGTIPVENKKGTYFSQNGKTNTIFTNRELEVYDWVFRADSDIFVVKSGENCLPFFSDFFKQELPYNLMSFCTNRQPPNPPYRTPESLRRVQFSSFEEWKTDFEALFGRNMLDRYCNPERWFMVPHNSLHAFPAKHFMSERWADCEFLIKVTRIMIDDEGSLSVWHSLGNEIGDLTETLDNCPMHLVVEPNVGHTVDTVHKLFDDGIPYIVHFGELTLETIWRKGIGAL